MKQWKAETLLLLITIIWGGTFTFSKIALNETTPLLFTFLRFSLAILITVVFFWKFLKGFNRDILRRGLILGLLFTGGFLFQTIGLNYTTATKSAFITGMAMVFTPFAFKLVIKKEVKNWQKAGIVIAFAGLWLFSNPEYNNINIGDILTLISCIFWALYITYMDVLTKDVRQFHINIKLVLLQFAVACPAGLIGTMIFEDGLHRIVFSNNLILALAYNGVVASVFLTLIHTSVQKYSTPVKAALIFSLEPIVAAIVAAIALGDSLILREYIGATILIFGVLLSELGEPAYQRLKFIVYKKNS